jgi:hypothetical protein
LRKNFVQAGVKPLQMRHKGFNWLIFTWLILPCLHPKQNTMKANYFVKSLYAINDALFIIVGTAVLFYRTPLLTDGIREIMLKVAHGI